MSNKKFSAFLAAASLLALAVFSGGCGGGTSGVADNGNPDGPDNYSSQIAEKLVAKANVHDLSAFIKDKTMTVSKGDTLLYYQKDGEDIRGYDDYLIRLYYALSQGAALAFVNVTAEEIDKLTDELALDLPAYLPDDATSKDKEEVEDFYAVLVRLDPDDETVANAYSYFGVDLISGDDVLKMTVYSGDQEIEFYPNEYTELTDVEYVYVDENGNVLSSDPNPMNYDYVHDCVDSFMDWVKEMNTMKAISEVSEAGIRSSAEEASAIFPGVSTSFNPLLHVEPRKYYFRSLFGCWRTHKAWHRDTSMTFNILPVHRFSDGADFYVVRVTGNTDTSKQYAHLSYMGYFTELNRIVEGFGSLKDGNLGCDNILGYNYIFQYTVQFMSGNTPVGSVYASAPSTMNSSTKVSKGFTFAIDGSVTGGVSAKDGLKADASIKPSWKWESKEEYTVNDYDCANISSGQTAGWKWEFRRPKDGSQFSFGGVWLEDVPLAGRSSVNLKSEFVIMVKKDDWKKYPSLKLVTEFKSSEGGTEGGKTVFGIGNIGRRDYSYDWSKKQDDYTLPRPPHIAVTQAKFNYKATDAKGDTQVVTLQSEEDWTATANASWIHLTTSDNNTTTKDGKESVSGKATGASQAQIMVSVDAVTDGKPRGGKVVFKASDGEICVIDILQAGK